MQKLIKKGDEKGFTLVELLVVIAIIAILAVVLIIAINPVELIKKGHNSRRLSDITEVRKAVDIALANATTSGASTPFTAGASGDSCSGTQSAGGTGWIPYNTAVMTLSTYIPALPNDPQNVSPNCYYFKAGSDGTKYEIDAVLENAGDAATTMANDGGNDANRYEVGTDLTII